MEITLKTLWQVFAVARNEFRFALRRGAPVVVTAGLGLLFGIGILIIPILDLKDRAQWDDFSSQEKEVYIEMGITPGILQSMERDGFADDTASSTVDAWFFMLLGLLFLPVATAGIIPADRQFGVLELIRSAPLKGGTYLAGKIVGLLGIVFFIACFPLLLFLAVLEGITLVVFKMGIPLYLIVFYLKLAIMGGVPVLLFASMIGALAGIAFHSRRAAIFPGFLTGILSLVAWRKVFQPSLTYTPLDYSAYFVFQGYHSIVDANWEKIWGSDSPIFDMTALGVDVPLIGIIKVIMMYACILAVLSVLILGARLWLHRKENF